MKCIDNSIIKHLSLHTKIKYLVYDIIKVVNENLTPNEILKVMNDKEREINKILSHTFDTDTYTNKELLDLSSTLIKSKHLEAEFIFDNIESNEKLNNLFKLLKTDRDKYNHYMSLLLELKRLYDLSTYYECYEIINEYFKGEGMEYTNENNTSYNIPYVLLLQLIFKYKYYCQEVDNSGNIFFDKEFRENYIKDIFIDLNNDKETHRDIEGIIEISRELNIIDDNDYTFLLNLYNSIKDIKIEFTRINDMDTTESIQ